VFGDFEDFVGHEPVRLAVQRIGRLGARSRDQAEDLSGLLVHPVPALVDAVTALRGQIDLVGIGRVGGGRASLEVAHVRVQRDRRPPSVGDESAQWRSFCP
jgi:hypothetical protein